MRQTCATLAKITLCERKMSSSGVHSYSNVIDWVQGPLSLGWPSQKVGHRSGTHYPWYSSLIASSYTSAEDERVVLRIEVGNYPSNDQLPGASRGWFCERCLRFIAIQIGLVAGIVTTRYVRSPFCESLSSSNGQRVPEW